MACANDEPIARHLNVSVRTVRRRIARIMDLLDVRSRFAAGVAAASLGWVTYSPPSPPRAPDRRDMMVPIPAQRSLRGTATLRAPIREQHATAHHGAGVRDGHPAGDRDHVDRVS
ncbi:hypothetical protein [Streptomyces sp. 8N616]|uniref:hypothetical protein n=1 Tax=Streptomyces sp. 8N616 TaxID=3457414 RepID=UPI003FD4BAE4